MLRSVEQGTHYTLGSASLITPLVRDGDYR